MSRARFRERIESPRPRSAIAMVALATATLALTEQVAPVALLWTSTAIGLTTLQRERSFAWQRNAWLLNATLLASVGVALLLLRQGQLAIVSLAHFAVLAQGLQLVDQRPRRSEFLLVALAVLQVVLAANLTDHLAFPLLLVAFTISVVWTLTVHTLRAEALEAGMPDAARRVISGGLLRTTGFASLLSIALAICLFPLLPRMRSGALLSKGLGTPIGMSGFSENVELGDLGRIRLDPAVVLRVESLDGSFPSPETRYWRGLAFDRFDGRRWAVTPGGREALKGDPEIGLDLDTQLLGAPLRQHITRERLDSGVLFAPGLVTHLRGAIGRLQRDRGGSLYALHSTDRRIDYEVEADVRSPTYLDLEADRIALPSDGGQRYLQLPPLDPRIAELGRTLVADGTSDVDRALALERYLRRSGRYTNVIPSHGGNGRSPIESFLIERTEGHCEYFASAMVVLARSQGMPARLVNGFAGGMVNRLGGFLEVTQSDAHTWVEVHFERAGWVRFDPTPPDLRLAGAAALRGEHWWTTLSSAVGLWWYRVVDFDRSSQGRVVRRAWLAWRRWRAGHRTPSPASTGPRPSRELPGTLSWVLGALAAGLLGAWAGWSRQRARATRLPAFYARALRLLARKGLVRGPAQTARSFASRVEQELPEDASRAFRALTERYLQLRFADGEPAAAASHRSPDASAELRRLRDSLRA